METIEKMNPLFKQGQAGDSKDFIIFLLEQFHKELKKSLKMPSNNNETKQPLNQYDKINALNYFFDELKKKHLLYQIHFLDLMKLQMNVLIIKIFLILEE